MSPAERVYRVLLRAYPERFRAAYGDAMAQLFRDRRRESPARRIGFWADVLVDLARSAPALRIDGWREWCSEHFDIEEGRMKTMAILAILIGSMEVVNSAAEAWVGGIVLHGGYSLVCGAMGTIAGAFLVASAIALMRRTTGAVAFTQRAAIACLTVFAFIAALRPMFSIFATMMGIGFPLVLLAFLRRNRGPGPSVPLTV